MCDFMINDESRPLPERKAWMILSHVPSVHGMRIDSIERCVSSSIGHEVVLRSGGQLYCVRTDRDYSNPKLSKVEVRLPEKKKVKVVAHSRTYERLSAQLFPTLA